MLILTRWIVNFLLKTKMEYYTLAKKVCKTYGHGDFGEEFNICPIDGYHTNSKEFHPLFKTIKEAKKYKDGIIWNHDLVVVGLKVYKT